MGDLAAMAPIASDPSAHAIGHLVVALLATLAAFCLIVLRQVSLPSPASSGRGAAVLLAGVLFFGAAQALEALAAVLAQPAGAALHEATSFASAGGLIVISSGLVLVAWGFVRSLRPLPFDPHDASVKTLETA
jgi:Ca2+/H+ antiporter